MKNLDLNRDFVVRGIYILYLITFAFKYYNGGFFHQFGNPLMMFPQLNITYWAFLLLKIPQFFTSNIYAAAFADLALLSSCVLLIVYPKKYIFAIVFTVFNWLNYMGWCMVNVYQPSLPIGMLLVSIPTMFKSDFKFSLSFWAVRFWACFLYFEAGLLKVTRGGALHLNHMSDLFKETMVHSLYQSQSHTLRDKIRYFIIEHEAFAQTLFVSATILEICFIIGFFTRKHDYLLLFLFLLFHFANYYLLGMVFLNSQIMLVCCFINWKNIELWANRKFGISLAHNLSK